LNSREALRYPLWLDADLMMLGCEILEEYNSKNETPANLDVTELHRTSLQIADRTEINRQPVN